MPSAEQDGPRVRVTHLSLEGCQAIACDAVLAAVSPLPSEPLGMAGIESLAQRVAEVYRRAGYPFVQVVAPPQTVEGGRLRLRIIEGVLGRAAVQGPDPLVPQAQAFLDSGMPVGQIIRERELERTMLLMDDQPGFRVRPTIRPGARAGEGDLDVEVTRQNRVSGEIGLDNIGSRSTGRHRLRAAVSANSPFRFGDRLALNVMTTDEQLWLGSLDYDTPLGATGWRGLAGVARTSYQLGGAFAVLGAKGYADTVTLKGSYAVLRSQRSNVQTSLAWVHKRLEDRYERIGFERNKTSDQLQLSAQFDHRDNWLGGGVSYGQISLTGGHLKLDDDARMVDAATARTDGGFTKANLDIARIQRVIGPVSAYLRVSAQWASANLDSSEKYGIGGFLGVRAYPMGEGTGDRGWLSQAELRWSLGQATAFAFADAGRMRINADPWAGSGATHRGLAGAGLGVRWGAEGWNVESTLASRVRGGKPQAESVDEPVRWFVTVSRRFE
nr:ShlB/FhaC/HecB family hemolysin secretion/activation protein [Aquabacterium fontiphilum]